VEPRYHANVQLSSEQFLRYILLSSHLYIEIQWHDGESSKSIVASGFSESSVPSTTRFHRALWYIISYIRNLGGFSCNR
jgi:hypothetical protein